MRTKIKVKFSFFLCILLLLTVLILSVTVLNGIKANQKVQYEEYLAQQAQTANIYFLQTLLQEENKVPQTFLTSNGKRFEEQLELISGQSVTLYNNNGTLISDKALKKESKRIKDTLEIALTNKTVYLVEDESLYYLSPLRIGKEQVGVVQFNFYLTEYFKFYERIKQLFIYVGASVFILSFILAFFYFDSFANGIIKLEKMVNRIRIGKYETTILPRKDEIGRLSQGIHAMSLQIQKTMVDMNEEKEKLTLAVEKLSLLDQQQKQFIGNVTHEFKTPLTSIKAYLDLLEMYPNDPYLLETAKENIKSETEKLYEMVVKVLQLSSMDKYDFEYKLEKIEIKKEILEVLKSLKGKLNKFGISLVLDLTEAVVEADRESLRIIFMNLFDNAIKYNKAEGRITVKIEEVDYVSIEIADTGIGIPEGLVQEIFEPFYTVDKNRSRENGGFGLGLSLAKKHTEIMGGSLTLVKTSEGGTTFRIMFPSAHLDGLKSK